MKRTLSALVAALTPTLVGLALAVPSAQAEEWKFALEEISGSVQDAYAQKFKELIEQKSGGDVSVAVYPYGALGTSGELTELVASGIIQFANASPGHLGTLVPEIQVFSIPYLLSPNEEVNKKILTESKTIYEDLAEDFSAKGITLLTMYPEGQMVWTTNREIRKPEDMAGFKMRTMVSPMLTAAYKAYGADPTPLPYAEVYGGLQLKMIDGQVNPIFAIEEMKFYEVSDYMIFTGEQQFTTTVITNSDWYGGLSDEHKTMIQEAIGEANGYIFDVQKQYNQERLDVIKEKKPEIQIIELTDEERQAFRERATPLRETYVEMVGPGGKEVLDSLLKELEQAEKEMAGS
jgi:tripartite ATP-independent transporter DctP family solute receptor